jgi:hypothetical protein
MAADREASNTGSGFRPQTGHGRTLSKQFKNMKQVFDVFISARFTAVLGGIEINLL